LNKLVVAHLIRSYLTQTETFVWQYLHNFNEVTPIVIAQRLENIEQFPLSSGKIRAIYGRRGSIPWAVDNWYRRFFKRPYGYFERIIKKEKIHLIHAHFGTMGSAFLKPTVSLGIPLITTFYGQDLSIIDLLSQHKGSYQELFEKGSHFLVEGPFMQDSLISIGCTEKKVSIQRIALNIEDYQSKTHTWDGKRPIRLLFVGRFIEKKGLEYALRALAKIKNKYSFQLRVIGGGNLEERLHLLASDLGLLKNIDWLGIQPHRKVIEELQACDILIQPSVTASNGDSEGGAPTIILEAQACGVPVVSTTHADIPYITSDESALLSPERNVDSLIENICYLFDNPEIWSQMGKKGRNHIERFHSIMKEVSALENIYKKFL